ncbi:DUF2892 domain-containing protein [Halorhodospira halochloris]|nr:DUF2892 domain-containing protein [Halorhodospira halochloris]MBK1650939.1 hypothetical protein [Halorhodospira halochloris]MCG5529305.1 DUF2892 domain-containing protein [Halorhodospira halochloris]MCG5547281.1 DUF2892 domain-containing protein [Halorhodospira halochloris]
MELKQNLGMIDRAARAVVGILLISLFFVGPQSAWGWIGLIPLATAIVGNCPAYIPLGFNTCSGK